MPHEGATLLRPANIYRKRDLRAAKEMIFTRQAADEKTINDEAG